MKYFTQLIIIFILIGCTENLRSQKFKNIKITVKSIVLNETFSQTLCINSGLNSLNNCYYNINDKRFLKKETYVFDDNMNPISFYNYLPEGPDIHSIEQMRTDTLYSDMVNFFDQRIILDIDNQFIIDGIDTIKNYEIFYDENLILINHNEYVNQPLSENRLVILVFEAK